MIGITTNSPNGPISPRPQARARPPTPRHIPQTPTPTNTAKTLLAKPSIPWKERRISICSTIYRSTRTRITSSASSLCLATAKRSVPPITTKAVDRPSRLRFPMKAVMSNIIILCSPPMLMMAGTPDFISTKTAPATKQIRYLKANTFAYSVITTSP